MKPSQGAKVASIAPVMEGEELGEELGEGPGEL
jgi:hypothetical protein